MTIYTFTDLDGRRFIWNTDRKITHAIIWVDKGLDSRFQQFQVYGNRGAAFKAKDSALYANAADLEISNVYPATPENLIEYQQQQDAAWAAFQALTN